MRFSRLQKGVINVIVCTDKAREHNLADAVMYVHTDKFPCKLQVTRTKYKQ